MGFEGFSHDGRIDNAPSSLKASPPVHIAILADAESWYFRELRRAAEGRGHQCVRGDFSAIVGAVVQNEPLLALGAEQTGPVDRVVVRSMPPGSLEQVILRMDVLARLEAAGIPVVNPPKALECAIDKYLTTARLAAAGWPVPDTVCCQTAEQALEWFHRLGADVVVKPLFGSEGRGIVRVSDPDLAWRVFTALDRIDAAIYLQRFVDHGGCDYRLLVLGDRLLGAMRRRSEGDFRTNVARQGIGEAHAPTESEMELAFQAAQIVGAPFAGIDLLYDHAGAVSVIEVNAVPGWKAFARVNHIDVAAEFIRYLEHM